MKVLTPCAPRYRGSFFLRSGRHDHDRHPESAKQEIRQARQEIQKEIEKSSRGQVISRELKKAEVQTFAFFISSH